MNKVQKALDDQAGLIPRFFIYLKKNIRSYWQKDGKHNRHGGVKMVAYKNYGHMLPFYRWL